MNTMKTGLSALALGLLSGSVACMSDTGGRGALAMAASPVVQQDAPAPAPPTPVPPGTKSILLGLLLDTSNSMDGLINQARSHLWNMVDQMGGMTRMVDGKLRTVRVELALYEYGNDTIAASDGYIRQVLPLTGDLDSVSEKLHGLFTNGGSEYAGQAIKTAVDKLQWSSDPDTMKFVFVAGNEEFDQGPITAQIAMELAAKKDINVQLIYCGTQDATWEAAAKIAKSDLMTIDQNKVAAHVAAPQDDEILRLGDELNSTYIAYGHEGQASMVRQKAADLSSAKMSKKVAIERMKLKTKKAYDNYKWDMVDAVDKKQDFLETAKEEELPAELRGKTLAEKKETVAAAAKKRAELKAKIAELEQARSEFVKAEKAKTGAKDEPSLDSELMKSTKKTAAKKGYKF